MTEVSLAASGSPLAMIVPTLIYLTVAWPTATSSPLYCLLPNVLTKIFLSIFAPFHHCQRVLHHGSGAHSMVHRWCRCIALLSPFGSRSNFGGQKADLLQKTQHSISQPTRDRHRDCGPYCLYYSVCDSMTMPWPHSRLIVNISSLHLCIL